MDDQVLKRLWLSAENEARMTGSSFSHVFEPVGLILIRPVAGEGYESTPLNSLAFAKTGGDGVHFSLLRIGGGTRGPSPIVMTVPMNFGNENLVLGSNIREFLCLGCQVGYFSLELLTYADSRSEAIYWLEHPEEWFAKHGQGVNGEDGVNRQKHLLGVLQRDLDLSPWEEFQQRIGHLQRQYLSMLEFQPGDVGAA